VAKLNLGDLKKSITDLSDEELLALIKAVRSSRRITRKADGPSRKQPSPAASLNAIVASASPDMIATLIKKAEEVKKSGA
jgi:hypothetical protein